MNTSVENQHRLVAAEGGGPDRGPDSDPAGAGSRVPQVGGNQNPAESAPEPTASKGDDKGPTLQIRISYVWNGEVMADVIVEADQPVMLGTSKKAHITIGDIGLPADFTILRPGAGVYLLTLGQDMAGRVLVDGHEIDVAEFVKAGDSARVEGAAGSFRATPVGEQDGGIIDLDGTGTHILTFQFMQSEPELPRSRWADLDVLLPALAFAFIFHTILVAATFGLRDPGYSLVFPGRTELMTNYLITRPPPPPPPPKPGPSEPAASKDGDKKNVKTATKGKKGKAGGKGKKPRQRDPKPSAVAPQVETGLLTQESRESIRRTTKNRAMDQRLRNSLARLKGKRLLAGGPGRGRGTGTGLGPGRRGTGTTRGGTGKGPGGGGNVQGDFLSQGKVDTGGTRRPRGTGGSGRGAKEVAVMSTGKASGDFGGLSKAEIDKVIRAKKGLIRSCYQRELNRSRGLGGKLVVNFRIRSNGTVQSARVVSGKSSLRNSKVESCVKRQITRLKFPAKGGGIVNYPFIFSQGG